MGAGTIRLFVRRAGRSGWGELGHSAYLTDSDEPAKRRPKAGFSRDEAIRHMKDAREGWRNNYPSFADASFKIEDHTTHYGHAEVVPV